MFLFWTQGAYAIADVTHKMSNKINERLCSRVAFGGGTKIACMISSDFHAGLNNELKFLLRSRECSYHAERGILGCNDRIYIVRSNDLTGVAALI